MYELKVVTHFAAAHQLKMVAKKCENLHGHNWKIEICVAGKDLNKAGVLIDFGELKQHVSIIMAKPSSENIAHYIAKTLQSMIDSSDIKVTRVTSWESENACATYIVP
jgi:6-pyruvoyltetrahydropterin/6-carboxytetrahydropterin synthase